MNINEHAILFQITQIKVKKERALLLMFVIHEFDTSSNVYVCHAWVSGFPMFPRFVYWILELFRQNGMFCFSFY